MECLRCLFLLTLAESVPATMAKEAGFKEAKYVSGEDIYRLYFANRADGLRAGQAEAFLIATT